MRNGLNAKLGADWEKASKVRKADAIREMLRDPFYVKELIERILSAKPDPYNLATDEKALVLWAELAYEISGVEPRQIAPPLAFTVPELDRIVIAVIDQFKHLLENRDLWRVLHYAPARKTEKTAQHLFFAIAYSYMQSNGIDITPEADTGNGPVDFKFSNGSTPKVLVELKLSKGRVFHGYEEQLPIYMKGEAADRGHYVVLDISSLGSKWAEVERLHAARNDPSYSIWLLDASAKASASKRLS